MPTPDRIALAADVIERLMADPGYRARFLADPASQLRADGLQGLAAEVDGSARPVQTLELRESRSSLAGMLMAAAAEGAALLHSSHAASGEAAAALHTAVHHRHVTMQAADHVAGLADAGPAIGRYPGDHASQAQIAVWMARAAKRAGLPPELPVMAALTESGLRNVPGGDRDSVGYFQMRVGIWDRGAYAGYPHDARLQLRWFIDRAHAVRQAEPSIGRSPGDYGHWIADVERCATEYRGRYAAQLTRARALIAEGGGTGHPPAHHHVAAHAPASAAPAAWYDHRPVVRDTASALPRAHHHRASDLIADAPSGGHAASRIRARIVDIAHHEIGVAERTTNDSPRIAQYRTATAGDPGPGPWCAYFVSWVARRAGVPIGSHGQGSGSVDTLWAWARAEGRAAAATPGVRPRPGDLIGFHEHIGIVERVLPGGSLRTIEGNYSDRVSEVTRSPSEAVGYIRMGA
jgi:hypothetical protein